MRIVTLWLCLLVLLSALLQACGSVRIEACLNSTDCEPSMICSNGSCQRPHTISQDGTLEQYHDKTSEKTSEAPLQDGSEGQISIEKSNELFPESAIPEPNSSEPSIPEQSIENAPPEHTIVPKTSLACGGKCKAQEICTATGCQACQDCPSQGLFVKLTAQKPLYPLLYPIDIAVDEAGARYVLGRFKGKLTLGNYNLVSKGSQSDVLLIKVDKNGILQWVKQLQSEIYPRLLRWDGKKALYLLGSFEKKIQIGSQTLNTQGKNALFIAKLHQDGHWLWSRSFGSKTRDWLRDAQVSPEGNIWISGQFRELATFGSFRLQGQKVKDPNKIEYTNGFIAQISPAGSFLWVKGLNASQVNFSKIAMGRKGDVFFTGAFSQTLRFDQKVLLTHSEKTSATFLLRLTRTGKVSWAKKFILNHQEIWPSPPAHLAVDSKNQIYIAGDFAPSLQAEKQKLFCHERGSFIVQIDDKGSQKMSMQLGDGINWTYLRAFRIDRQDRLVLMGSFFGHLSFGQAAFYAPFGDLFLVRLDQKGQMLGGQMSKKSSYGTTHSISGELLSTALALGPNGHIHLVGSTRTGMSYKTQKKPLAEDEGALFILRFEKLSCPSNHSICGGLCASLKWNPLHCGFCRNRCQTKEQCIQGRCELPTDTPTSLKTGTFRNQNNHNHAELQDIANSPKGEQYITGFYRSAFSFGGVQFPHSTSGFHYFLAKLDVKGQITHWVSFPSPTYNLLSRNLSYDKQVSNPGNTLPRRNQILFDKNGYLYIAVKIEKTISIGKKQFRPQGKHTILLLKLNPSLGVEWSVQLSSQHPISLNGITVQTNGLLFLAGQFGQKLQLGTLTIHSVQSAAYETFLASFSDKGVLLSTSNLGIQKELKILKVDTNGSLYFAGTFTGKISWGNKSFVASNTGTNWFIAKKPPSKQPELLYQMKTKSYGEIYFRDGQLGKDALLLTGAIRGDWSFSKVQTTRPFPNRLRLFLMRFDLKTNQPSLLFQAGSAGSDEGFKLQIDHQGFLHLLARFSNGLTLGKQKLWGKDIEGFFLAKFDASGNFKELKQITHFPSVYPNSFAIRQDKSIQVVGSFSFMGAWGTLKKSCDFCPPRASNVFIANYPAFKN